MAEFGSRACWGVGGEGVTNSGGAVGIEESDPSRRRRDWQGVGRREGAEKSSRILGG